MSGLVNAAVQEPPKTETSGVLNKNTGFPEPLSRHRNTTLRHPSANISPNASIDSSDVSVARTHSRHSSLQLPPTDGSGTKGPLANAKDGSRNDDIVQSQMDGTTRDSRSAEMRTGENSDGHRNGDGTFLQRIEGRKKDEQPDRDAERKKGVMRKLHFHKA